MLLSAIGDNLQCVQPLSLPVLAVLQSSLDVSCQCPKSLCSHCLGSIEYAHCANSIHMFMWDGVLGRHVHDRTKVATYETQAQARCRTGPRPTGVGSTRYPSIRASAAALFSSDMIVSLFQRSQTGHARRHERRDWQLYLLIAAQQVKRCDGSRQTQRGADRKDFV